MTFEEFKRFMNINYENRLALVKIQQLFRLLDNQNINSVSISRFLLITDYICANPDVVFTIWESVIWKW